MTIERDSHSNKIKFLETKGIPYHTWLKLLARINHLGYDMPNVDALRAYFDRGHYLNEDQSIEVLLVFGEMTPVEKISPAQRDKINRKAVDYFGETNRLSLAGYILTDGTLLKMSYDGYQRDIDHREIKDVLDYVDTSNDISAAMIEFINYGNIRLLDRGFEISQPPTEAQRKIISQYIRKVRNSDYTYLYVDISNDEGRVVHTSEYDFPSISEVFSDIEKYFDSISLHYKGETVYDE